MPEITIEEIKQLTGPVMLEFGAEWCGYCQAAQVIIAEALSQHPHVKHIKIEDGKGKRLGRLMGVKLWPSLIFINQGEEIGRLVRPTVSKAIAQELAIVAQLSHA